LFAYHRLEHAVARWGTRHHFDAGARVLVLEYDDQDRMDSLSRSHNLRLRYARVVGEVPVEEIMSRLEKSAPRWAAWAKEMLEPVLF
jgi:hypothetical protein